MRIWVLSLAAILSASPAIAENWLYAGIEASGKVISVDATSLQRTLKDFSRISYQVRVESVEEMIQAKVAGNCSTGSWRILSLKHNNKGFTPDQALMLLPQDAGDRSLRLACSMPLPISQKSNN